MVGSISIFLERLHKMMKKKFHNIKIVSWIVVTATSNIYEAYPKYPRTVYMDRK